MKKINLEVSCIQNGLGYWNSCKCLPNFINVAALALAALLFRTVEPFVQLWKKSAEWNRLCNYGRGYYVEHIYEIILNLDQWFQDISTALVALLFSSVVTICEILVEGFMRNISVKLF